MAIGMGKIRQTTSVTRKGEGEEEYLKLLRDGTLTIENWIAALSLEGRVFTWNSGFETTPADLCDTTLDDSEFDMHIAVPSTVVIVPLEMNIVFDVFGTAQIVEVVMLSGSGSVTGAGASGYSSTAQSSNISSGLSTACTLTSVATAGTAFTTNKKEIFHGGNQYAITAAGPTQQGQQEIFRWRAKESGVYDVVGPSQQLGVIASAQNGTGFISLKWAELPVTAAR